MTCMKNRLLSFLALLFFASFLPSTSRATHAAGGEIVYEHLFDSTYRIYFKFYRDCGGNPEPPTVNLCYYSSCDPIVRSRVMPKWTGLIPPGVINGSDVTLGCSGSNTECTGDASIPGVKEWWYSIDLELDHKCNFWTFSAVINARNGSVNLDNATCVDFYVETTFNNLFAPKNSSPYFEKKPIPYTCLNLPYSFNNQAVDPDPSDSVWSEIVVPLTTPSTLGGCTNAPTPCTLNPTAVPALNTINNPFQTATLAAPTGSFNINGNSGQMNFTATQTGPQTLVVRVKEYRNGILIGSIIRDVQVQVLDPSKCNYTPSTIDPAVSIRDAGYNPITGQIMACANQNMEFCFDIATTDPVGKLVIGDNSKTSKALDGMTVTYTGQRTKSVRGCVNWTPGNHQTGLRNLIIGVKDSTCHPPGIIFEQSFTIPIYVYPAVQIYKDTSICPGDKVQLVATNGGNFQWQELGGGTSTLSCTNCIAPTVTPYTTLQYIAESKLTTFCNHNKDTVTVTMLPIPEHDNMQDVTICPGNIVNYDLKIKKQPGVTYTVSWTPATYLTSATSETNTSTPLNDIEYHIVVAASDNRCKSFDTARINLLDGFKIETPDLAICEGQTVDAKAIGDPNYTYTWSTDPKAAADFTDPAILDPTVTPKVRGKMKVVLTATRAGCKDSVASFDLDVQPVPNVAVNDDQTICYGDTMTLTGIVTPADYDRYSYQWTPSATLANGNTKRPLFSAFQDVTMKLIASTPAGCKGEDSLKIDVLPADFMTLSADTAICPGQEARLRMVGIDLTSFWWDEGSHHMNDRKSQNPVVRPVVSKTYTVYGIDKNGCKDTQKVHVEVKPAAVVYLPDTLKLYPGESVKINPSGNALHYSWFPPVGLSRADIADPTASPKVNTRYFVTARTEAGCEVRDSVNVMLANDSHLDIPNAFSPGKGGNGTLKVLRLGQAQLKRFTIFNRWGVKMFETTDINQGWDGMYKGSPQPMGVYMYSVEAVTPTGRIFNQNGNVTMIR
ncbi:MAG: gliding motility-associated C-terminal domain-containing protein [Sphingobacteriales bacterium]|nr:MAG: gliding motility-associated C-terminal domain-containing protein [Sphingobacteriales bacterium]